ncbi:unnamed protein product [Zymoseptoria tritici ST99CH_3D7]|uniref:CID domain-containing protein n=2 Tax=Zymoseptoria tritici TaxID=1047171 RepID=A0A1X7S2U5_ZYMT9|nr:unnamed protein product [Zymoseptoria tritici ST99CH_3D7]SMR57106.1 unnamed protein product [Zymoseptoria tritici ST99CH_1E4]
MQNNSEAVNARIAGVRLVGALHPHLNNAEGRAFVRLLNKTFNICSIKNVQLCKRSIIRYVLPAESKTAILLNYLENMSKLLAPRPANTKKLSEPTGYDWHEGLDVRDGIMMQPPPSAAQRMHILYIVHAVLVTVHGWQKRGALPAAISHTDLSQRLDLLRNHAIRLFKLAACHGIVHADNASKPLAALAAQWEQTQIFPSEEISDLVSLTQDEGRSLEDVIADLKVADEKKVVQDRLDRAEATKWVVPIRHGVKDDPNAPWHELPAANSLNLKNIRGFPLRAGGLPAGGYKLRNGGHEASEDLQKEVKWLHKEILHVFDDFTDPAEVLDIDPLGNKVWKDPERPTRNYWGFTLDGREKAKAVRKKFREEAIGYEGVPWLQDDPAEAKHSAIERARALAAGRAPVDNGRGRGGWNGGPSGFDGNRGGRGGWRGDQRGGHGDMRTSWNGDARGGWNGGGRGAWGGEGRGGGSRGQGRGTGRGGEYRGF